MPVACIQNDMYRHGFIYQFSKEVVQCFDCPETNIEAYGRPKAFHYAQMLKQVCPKLFPLADYELKDTNSENRLALEVLIKNENEKLQLLSSELGQVFILYPKMLIDDSETVRMTTSKIESEL